MNNQTLYSKIAPVSDDGFRPLWSVMVPTYNNAAYLAECLQSVLQQDPGESVMEIYVVDDVSTLGDPEKIVNKVGQGRIKFFRQPKNVGSAENFNTAINLARGKYIHLLHGDDLVLPGYYSEIAGIFDDFPEAGAAFCGCELIDAEGKKKGSGLQLQNTRGILPRWIETIAVQKCVQTPTITVKREVYEKVGGFITIHVEDWEMWVRMAQSVKFAYSPKVLCQYRLLYVNNNSARYMLSGENVQEFGRALTLFQNYLPGKLKTTLGAKARKNASIYLTREAIRYYRKFGNKEACLSQAKNAFELYPNPRSLAFGLLLFLETKGIKLARLESLN